MFGLYLHIPFCQRICTYCDFYKMRAKLVEKEKYIDYLIKEIALLRNESLPPIDTIYLGGGTPSSIPPKSLRKLFEALAEFTNLKTLSEFTIELNPEDITVELALLLKEFHISRLSIGIQSFNPKVQKILGRYHDYDDVLKKVFLLNEYGLTNLNFDFIYGIPNTSIDDVITDLNLFLTLKPKHLSCYSLILEEKTVLYHQYLKGEFTPIVEELEATMYDEIKNHLLKQGFIHYETSNYAYSGYESSHNLIYWSNDRYRGIGAGSSSYVGNRRFKTVANLNQYYDGINNSVINLAEDINLSITEQMKEEVMLGLRKTKGINLTTFSKRYGCQIINAFPTIPSLINQGILVKENDHLAIKPNFQYLANYIIRKII